MLRVAICAPSTPLAREDADRVAALAADYPGIALHFHPQCFASEGHFAGSDALRCEALVECANDPAFDAVWFARGGYGANRIAQEWNEPSACRKDFDDLVYDNRGTRKGFPPDVLGELLTLRDYYYGYDLALAREA